MTAAIAVEGRPRARRAARRSWPGGRIGVLDIGSNSIRLVVYDRPSRTPIPVFNEKVMCGLARGLTGSGLLSADGIESAFANLGRFAEIARAMRVGRVEALATAAVRDAANGTEFVAEVERRFGFAVRVISGEEEARLSALGVLSGFPGASGVVGDLGGGSLELVRLVEGEIAELVTLPLGPLRLNGLAGNHEGLVDHIDAVLAGVPWLDRAAGGTLYAVGGSWRSIARADMAFAGYELHVIHGYELERRRAIDGLKRIERAARKGGKGIVGVSRRRVETLPAAAAVLERVLRKADLARVVFSAYGLREGCLFDGLPPARRGADPLLAAAVDIARDVSRFAPHAGELMRWMAPLFEGEPAGQHRLRRVACHLSDIAWAEHPDYRGSIAYQRVLHLPVAGIDHPGRAFVALALFARYAGQTDDAALAVAKALLSPEGLRAATVLGHALRLAHTMTGGAPGLLGDARLEAGPKTLTLTVARRRGDLVGDIVQRRLQSLAQAVGLAPRLAVGRQE